jgi:capsular polysaccharide biosynthesis protein
MRTYEYNSQEDEIDLKELLKTIIKYKKTIVIFTAIITIGAIIWILIQTPFYEARALVEIGSYKNNNDTVVLLENNNQLVKKLNFLFIDMKKNIKNGLSKINTIKVSKGSNEFIEIKSLAVSNKLAKKEILQVINYIQSQHQKILDEIKQRREIEIKNIDAKINNIKDKKDILATIITNNLKENKLFVSSLMLPHNCKNTQIVGEIITNDKPIKPKKILIVTVAFITGLILSIFLVFFIEFIKDEKKGKKDV